MKKVFVLLFAALLYTIAGYAQDNAQSIKDFGAKGDGVTDDTQAFTKAVQTAQTLIIPKGTYNIKGKITFYNLKNKTIVAQGAIIRNTDNTTATIEFALCDNIAIHGGTWTYTSLPTGNRTGAEYAFRFTSSKNIEVTNAHIIGSSEAGIGLICIIGANISNNIIEQCYRDGIYSHYSSNLVYCGNYIHDIKDDAMSIHDYGLVAQRCILTPNGISQAGNSIIFNNVTRNTYEGFSSIGCTRLFIANNDIQNTVTGGISVFTSDLLFVGSTAHANKIIISNNTLSYVGGNPKIMHDHHKNDAQLGTGRAAIFVGATDMKATMLAAKLRLQYITVNNNTVTNSYENGLYAGQIDHFNLFNNTFTDNNINNNSNTGKTVEIKSCNGVNIGNNTINDKRTEVSDKDLTYSLDQVNGNIGKWNVNSRMVKKIFDVSSSSLQNDTELSKDISLDLPEINLAPSEYKIIRKPFSPGLLTDYINLVPPANTSSKLVCNACIDPDSGGVIVIMRNTGSQPIRVSNAANWTVREFYHN